MLPLLTLFCPVFGGVLSFLSELTKFLLILSISLLFSIARTSYSEYKEVYYNAKFLDSDLMKYLLIFGVVSQTFSPTG